MPWWTNVDMAFATVTSCPPPGVPVDTKTLTNLPASAPDAQSWPVVSQKACEGS